MGNNINAAMFLNFLLFIVQGIFTRKLTIEFGLNMDEKVVETYQSSKITDYALQHQNFTVVYNIWNDGFALDVLYLSYNKLTNMNGVKFYGFEKNDLS